MNLLIIILLILNFAGVFSDLSDIKDSIAACEVRK